MNVLSIAGAVGNLAKNIIGAFKVDPTKQLEATIELEKSASNERQSKMQIEQSDLKSRRDSLIAIVTNHDIPSDIRRFAYYSSEMFCYLCFIVGCYFVYGGHADLMVSSNWQETLLKSPKLIVGALFVKRALNFQLGYSNDGSQYIG